VGFEERFAMADTDSGFWAMPGGVMEINETIETCARREVREETDSVLEIETGTQGRKIYLIRGSLWLGRRIRGRETAPVCGAFAVAI
jgi:8-oxo-dGTP pyrophosphatase MutT (NUDIX family)